MPTAINNGLNDIYRRAMERAREQLQRNRSNAVVLDAITSTGEFELVSDHAGFSTYTLTGGFSGGNRNNYSDISDDEDSVSFDEIISNSRKLEQ